LLGSRFDIGATLTDGDRYDPDVVYNPDAKEYLVVYEFDDGFGKSIRAYRVTSAGQKIGSEITIAGRTSTDDHLGPAVDYAGTDKLYLVVWEHIDYAWGGVHAIAGRVLSSQGAPMGGGGPGDPYYWYHISLFDATFREKPDVAYDRRMNRYLVVWQQGSLGDHDIYGRQVHGDGTPVANPTSIEIYKFSQEQISPSVAAIRTFGTKGQYLVAFEDRYPWPTRGLIRVTWLDGDGAVLPQGGIDVLSQSSHDRDSRAPSVAGNENSKAYLVTWTQEHWEGLLFWDSISVREVGADKSMRSDEIEVFGWAAGNSAAAAGRSGDFMVVREDYVWGQSNQGIYGQLWGNRAYLPLVKRRH